MIESSSTKRVEGETYLKKMDISDSTSSPVEFKEMKSDLEKTTLMGTHPNDAKEESSGNKRVERESYLKKTDISDSTSSPVEFKEMKSDLEKTTLMGTHPNEAKEETVPVDLIEKKTNMERIHLLGTTPDETTNP